MQNILYIFHIQYIHCIQHSPRAATSRDESWRACCQSNGDPEICDLELRFQWFFWIFEPKSSLRINFSLGKSWFWENCQTVLEVKLFSPHVRIRTCRKRHEFSWSAQKRCCFWSNSLWKHNAESQISGSWRSGDLGGLRSAISSQVRRGVVKDSIHTRRDRAFLRTMHLFPQELLGFGGVDRRRGSPGEIYWFVALHICFLSDKCISNKNSFVQPTKTVLFGVRFVRTKFSGNQWFCSTGFVGQFVILVCLSDKYFCRNKSKEFCYLSDNLSNNLSNSLSDK
mgnify:CR=1 FL=1